MPLSVYSKYPLSLLVAVWLSACGGGSGSPTPSSPAPLPRSMLSVSYAGQSMVKIQGQGNSWVAMIEKPHGFMDQVVMDRQLQISDIAGTSPSAWRPPSGWTLVDFALHPSREISAVLSNGNSLMLVRLSSAGTPLAMQEFVDPNVALDPYYALPGDVRNRAAMSPLKTLDAANISAAGANVGVALRSGSNSVVAYRFDYANGKFAQRWRQLVEPGIYLEGLRPTSGTYDPFGGVDNHWQVHMDMDARGRMAIAVLVSGRSDITSAHADHFKDTLPLTLTNGVLLTVLDENGSRSPSLAIDNREKSELHAVKWSGDAVLVAGRLRTARTPAGDGWDGYVAQVDTSSRQVTYRLIDIDRGEAVFDVLPLGKNKVLLAGTAAYTQNPGGESVSETSAPLLASVDMMSGALSRLPVAEGRRGNQLRSVIPYRNHWLVGGMDNVPGTHSADADASLLTSDAYVRELDIVID